jgi:hypothetical protein
VWRIRVCAHSCDEGKKRKEQQNCVGVTRKVDVSELSTSGNLSLATRRNLALKEIIICRGYGEEH